MMKYKNRALKELTSDYFSNHDRKFRLPWKMYHMPIVRELSRTLDSMPQQSVLNIGSGPFQEREYLPSKHRYHICDIDERAIDRARKLHGDRITEYRVIDRNNGLPYRSGQFNVVFACDVIEHIENGLTWLQEIDRVLVPEGRLILTTPNYGWSTLPIIENTVLELVARMQGFSRKDIHPSKYSMPTLRRILERIGHCEISVKRISWGWVLFSSSKKRVADNSVYFSQTEAGDEETDNM